MQEKSRILVADDEADIRQILTLLLSGDGYEVTAVSNGQEAAERADGTIDLYILDVNMPVMTGFAAAAKIRETWDTPIIFLTAYSGENDKIMGFSSGADDYIVKPFSNIELLLRVRALLRRAKGARASAGQAEKSAGDRCLTLKDLILDPDSQTLTKGGEVIPLTSTEFGIMELFLSHPKKIYSLENIYHSIWQEEAVGDSTIMVHIKNIRKKLGDNSRNPQYIRTAWGKGYYVE